MFKVVERGDLAGGMAGQRECELIAGDAAAVVDHRNLFDAAGSEFDADCLSAGIKTVFQQFLQCGRRAFDHFACGDLVDQEFRQQADRGHAGIISGARRVISIADEGIKTMHGIVSREAVAADFCLIINPHCARP